uniref:Coiled-coil domain containing 81 n=1 Tax=Canis lupus familiaris TaxID=9615 RepID=A0A8C0RHI7_CANLF
MDGTGALAKALANRPDTVDSVLSSREILGKRPNSVLAFPRIDLKEVENKPHMETIVEEGRKNRQRKYKLKDQPDKEEGIREILSKRLQDKQAISPPKTTSVNLLNKLEQNRDGGKIMNPESLSSPGCLKNDSEMKSKLSPAPVCQDHNKAGQMRSLASREQNKKNAAYNLGVAEAMRIYKNEKPAFYKSFLFDKRPLSPEINAFKQEEYSQSLLKQMDNRREKEIKQRQNRELMDRLEQVQLTEELAAQRAQYIKDKMEETQCYKRALDAQIKNKPLQLPMFEPDSCEPIFGKDEGELMVQKRKQEQSYMKHQLEAAASLKRKAILQQLVEQKQDLQMLRRTQKEHLADRNAELERVNRINQSLQEDWESSAAMKRQRDLEEKAFERASDKLFLLDQCEKYRRCKQCQRRTSNVGESNLWPLNKYLHGSRLLV